MTYLYSTLAILVLLRILVIFYKPNRVWSIKSGHHYVSFWERTKYFVWWGMTWKLRTTSMSYDVVFDNTCVYYLPTGQDSWNKLPGVQKGFDKTNRILAGWRCMHSPALYWFDCIRYSHENSSKHTIGMEFKVEKQVPSHAFGSIYKVLSHVNIPTPGLFPTLPLFPYFGGELPVPENRGPVNIRIENLRINGKSV